MYQAWEKNSLSLSSPAHVKRSPATPLLIVPPPASVLYNPKMPSPATNNTLDSQDFDDLIFALKTGGAYVGGSDSSQVEKPAVRGQFEKRRINIADTHL